MSEKRTKGLIVVLITICIDTIGQGLLFCPFQHGLLIPIYALIRKMKFSIGHENKKASQKLQGFFRGRVYFREVYESE